MGLFVPNNPSFGYLTGNVLGVRPAASMGTSVTVGTSNSYGSYVEVLAAASLTRDCYGILLNFNNGFITTQSRDTIVTIGVDPAGGTAWVDTIHHLLAVGAGDFTSALGGHWYYFPLFIPAGASIAAKASVNNANAGTINCCVWLYGAPKNLAGLVYGQGVETVGINTAISAGASVTPGTTLEGSWTLLGTTTKKWKFVQHGVGIDDASNNSGSLYAADLAAGNGPILDLDRWIRASGNQENWSSSLRSHLFCDLPAGETIYGRMQCSGALDSGISMAAYGVY